VSLDRERIGWPVAGLPQALAAVARSYGLHASESDADTALDGALPESWIAHCAARLELEALPVQATYRRLRTSLARCAPALIRIDGPAAPCFVVVVAGGRHTLAALTPGLHTVRIRLEDVRAALAGTAEAAAQAELAPLLSGVAERRRERTGERLLRERLAEKRFTLGWMLRPAPGRGARPWAREYGLWAPGLGLLFGHAAAAVLWLLSWWWLAQGALSGHFDAGRLAGWSLLLASAFLARLGAFAASGVLSVRIGALLKRRLLEGALRLSSEEVRAFGVGQFLGRVMEGETLEQAAIAGGLVGLMSLIDLALAALVLVGAGSAGLVLVAFMAAWTAVGIGLAVRYFRARRLWTDARLGLTNALVESMEGHRTRLAQGFELRERTREDIAVEGYLRSSQSVDRASAKLQIVLPRGWLLGGILGLAPVIAAGGLSATALALGLGGVLLAYQAFREFAAGLERVMAGAAAWSWIRPFWEAAGRPAELGQTRYATAAAGANPGRPRIEVRNVHFGHVARAGTVFDGIDFSVRDGDRVLLGGASGGGKSTLASLLAGLRIPQSGMLLLDGLDRASLGEEAWRRRVLVVPQFHENHILMGTLAFNLLLGRGWPADAAALEEAQRACRALGLGPLLERMPGGLNQSIGDTGWQLSHGERDRVFLARALLQRPDILILDESLSALDPLTLREVFAAVSARARTLLLIAHP
jgi:ATP-binding cassette subfamily B protein